MAEYQLYVLFPNHDNGMRLHKELRALGLRSQIAPTPRVASKCCGISLLIAEAEQPAVEACIAAHAIEILEIVKLEKDVNPHRDTYC